MYKKWAPIQEKFGSEMFSIGYRCQDMKDILIYCLKLLMPDIDAEGILKLLVARALPPLISIVATLLDMAYNNPFNYAFEQAKLTGRYLA